MLVRPLPALSTNRARTPRQATAIDNGVILVGWNKTIRTFQVAPKPADCEPSVPNSAFANGLMVSMMDGSIRTLRGSIGESTFWALVTPAAGDFPGDW